MTKKFRIGPQSQVLLECRLAKLSDQYHYCTGLVIPSDSLEDKSSIALTSSLSKIIDTGKVFVSAINISGKKVTLKNQTEIAHFETLNEAQADNLMKIDPRLFSLAKMRNPDDFGGELNQLIQEFHFEKIDTPTARPTPNYSKLWFPTPETSKDFSNLTRLQREFYDQFFLRQRQEKKDPKGNEADELKFLTKFSWDTCVLNADQKRQLEQFLFE